MDGYSDLTTACWLPPALQLETCIELDSLTSLILSGHDVRHALVMTSQTTAARQTRRLSSPPMRVGSVSKNPAPVTENMSHKAQHVEFRNFTHLLSIRQVELGWHATPLTIFWWHGAHQRPADTIAARSQANTSAVLSTLRTRTSTSRNRDTFRSKEVNAGYSTGLITVDTKPEEVGWWGWELDGQFVIFAQFLNESRLSLVDESTGDPATGCCEYGTPAVEHREDILWTPRLLARSPAARGVLGSFSPHRRPSVRRTRTQNILRAPPAWIYNTDVHSPRAASGRAGICHAFCSGVLSDAYTIARTFV
ncbi:hypothetical protein VTO73DRAFT_15087 [Trametes versicolor]